MFLGGRDLNMGLECDITVHTTFLKNCGRS